MSSTATRLNTALDWPASTAGLPFPPVVLLGLSLLYLPIYIHLSNTLWRQEEYAHGPIIAFASAFLFWRERARLSALPSPPNFLAGGLIFAAGLLMAWLGITQDIPLIATLSQLPVLTGILLVLHGGSGLRVAAFPLLFLLFMVPLPGLLVDALTLQLKELISAAAVQLLHATGYPVARSGVIIVIGQYQMLVANACSGLHSLFSLSALGLLYVHLRPEKQVWHKALMIAAIVPIAIVANFLRTLALLLITYHAGDVAARAWHDAAGIILFVFALMLLSGTDNFLARIGARRSA